MNKKGNNNNNTKVNKIIIKGWFYNNSTNIDICLLCLDCYIIYKEKLFKIIFKCNYSAIILYFITYVIPHVNPFNTDCSLHVICPSNWYMEFITLSGFIWMNLGIPYKQWCEDCRSFFIYYLVHQYSNFVNMDFVDRQNI